MIHLSALIKSEPLKRAQTAISVIHEINEFHLAVFVQLFSGRGVGEGGEGEGEGV